MLSDALTTHLKWCHHLWQCFLYRWGSASLEDMLTTKQQNMEQWQSTKNWLCSSSHYWAKLIELLVTWCKSTYGELHNAHVRSSLVTALLWKIYDHHDQWVCLPQTSFPWGYLKDNMYMNNPQSIEELHQNNERCTSTISQETLLMIQQTW